MLARKHVKIVTAVNTASSTLSMLWFMGGRGQHLGNGHEIKDPALFRTVIINSLREYGCLPKTYVLKLFKRS